MQVNCLKCYKPFATVAPKVGGWHNLGWVWCSFACFGQHAADPGIRNVGKVYISSHGSQATFIVENAVYRLEKTDPYLVGAAVKKGSASNIAMEEETAEVSQQKCRDCALPLPDNWATFQSNGRTYKRVRCGPCRARQLLEQWEEVASEKVEGIKCVCPKENFSWNATGCQCGAAKLEKRLKPCKTCGRGLREE